MTEEKALSEKIRKIIPMKEELEEYTGQKFMWSEVLGKEDVAHAVERLKEKEDIEFGNLMEAISEFALFEGTGVWDSSKIFGDTKPNIKFIGDKIIEISNIKDEIFGDLK